MRPPLPAHALLRGAKRPCIEPERGVYGRAERAGKSFFGISWKWLGGMGKVVAGKLLFPRDKVNPLHILN